MILYFAQRFVTLIKPALKYVLHTVVVSLFVFQMRFWYIHNVQTIQKYVLCHCWTHLCLKLSLKWLNRYFPLPVFVMMCEFLKNKMFFIWALEKECELLELVIWIMVKTKASALIKAFTWWVMKLWMAQTWYCNICTWDWCNSGQSRI